jgi:hypothetical protein
LPLPYETKGAELILFFAEFSYTATTLQKVDAVFPGNDCLLYDFLSPLVFSGLSAGIEVAAQNFSDTQNEKKLMAGANPVLREVTVSNLCVNSFPRVCLFRTARM